MAERLIDADGARRRIIAFATGLHSEVLPVDTVVMLLIQMPTVDAVEVVRCRDCKRCFKHTTKRNRQCMWICMRNDTDLYVRPDDFCSYGERKDGDGNG